MLKKAGNNSKTAPIKLVTLDFCLVYNLCTSLLKMWRFQPLTDPRARPPDQYRCSRVKATTRGIMATRAPVMTTE